MARPGVREKDIRRSRDGRKKLREAKGDSRFEGISVKGHCIGIQGRTWRLPAQTSGYPYALDAANEVIKAGKMRTSRAPAGALVWWSTGGYPGHVATVSDDRDHVWGNVGYVIALKPIDYFGNFRMIGWCYPGDVPGWVGSAHRKR